MTEQELSTKQRILKAAKEEFLRLGFQNSSLRSIVKEAGVTTGAFYGYYTDKTSLFDALVKEPAEKLYEIYLRAHEDFEVMPPDLQISEMSQTSKSGVRECFQYIYEHFDAFKLLICCGEGTSYEDYLHRLAKIEADSSLTFFTCMENVGKPVPTVSEDLNHILASAYLSGFFEVVVHDMSKEEAWAYVDKLTDFFAAGWKNLLGLV